MRKTSRKNPKAAKALSNRTGSAAAKRDSAAVEADRWLDNFVPYHLYRVTNKLNARLLKRLKSMRINSSQ